MSHRRPPRPTRAAVLRRASLLTPARQAAPAGPGWAGRFVVDRLETRQMLTTVDGFGSGLTETLFTDGQGNPAVIYSDDVTFEAIGAHRGTSATTPDATLGDLEPYPLPTGGTPAPTGTDVFKIYVTESAADSYIAITDFTPYPGPPGQEPNFLLPYSGTVGTVGVADAGGIENAELPSVGAILVGGVFFGPGLSGPRTDLTTSLALTQPIGLQPAPAGGFLEAGVEVIPRNAATGAQNDFGNLVIGGDVTGAVSFGGNVNEFYAGGIYTGQSAGGSLFGNFVGLPTAFTSTSPDPGNFTVAGDLRELLSGGQIGTDGGVLPTIDGNPNNDPGFFNYVSNFDLTVGGTLGEIHTGNQAAGLTGSTFAGTVHVFHSTTVSGQVTPAAGQVAGDFAPTREVEDVAATAATAAEFVNPPDIGLPNTPADNFVNGQVDFTNDTPADAQLLNSYAETNPDTGAVLRDASGNLIDHAEVTGQIAILNGDTVDTYGMAFQAGATYTLALTDTNGTAISLEVLDPDGRIIQSNAEAQGGPIQVKADRPGIYHFVISDGQTTFYTLDITQVGDVALGGFVVNGSYSDTGVDGGITVAAGDIGAIELTGVYYALTAGPTITTVTPSAATFASSSIVLGTGSLRALIAGSLGETSVNPSYFFGDQEFKGGDSLIFNFGPTFNIPVGGIGLVQTTDVLGVMDFNSQFDPNALLLGQHVTDDTYAHAVHSGIQVIDAANSFQGMVATDAGLGTIRAGNMNTDLPSFIDVNADNAGNDGLIDMIDVEGQLGNLGTGGPSLVTHDGGHVRYMRVAGAVFLPAQFSGLRDEPVIQPIGAGMSFTDDTGNVINLTPFGVTTTTTNSSTGSTANSSGGSATNGSGGSTTLVFSPSPGVQVTEVTDSTTGAISTTTVTGPQLSVLSYPVSDKGGQIPLSISSTGSLQITANGGAGRASSVDLNQVVIAGTGRPLVETGTDQFGNVTVTQPVPANTSSGVLANTAGTGINTAELTGAGNTDPSDLFLLVTGSATVNVYSVTSVQTITGFVGGAPTGATSPGNQGTAGVNGADTSVTLPGTATPILIGNTTGGEVANISTPGVGTINVRGNLGFITPQATAAAVYARPVVDGGNSYPFAQQHTSIDIFNDTYPTSGDAVNVTAGGALGNVIAAGSIASLIADAGNRPAAGVFAGIVAPVVAARLLYVQVGQGLTDTGTGAVGLSGLFATNKIGEVTNAGLPSADIRGNIVTLGIGNVTGSLLNSIRVSNASIIGSNIEDIAGVAYTSTGQAFSATADIGGPDRVALEGFNPVNAGGNSVYDIASVTVSGNGGIIGSDISAGSVGPITIGRGGFGILDTVIEGLSAGRVGGITAYGYGIRQVEINNGGFVGPISAPDTGALVGVNTFPLSVRPSDDQTGGFDPFTGNPITNANDLNVALGGTTSSQVPSLPNVTDTGVIEDLVVNAAKDMVGISALKIRTAEPVTSGTTTPEPAQANIPAVGVQFATSINTAGRLGYVRVGQVIDGLQITAASIGQFTQTGNVNRLGIAVSGRLNSLTIRGNLGSIIADPATGNPIGDSYIVANGRAGSIGTLNVLGSLYANVTSVGSIGRINVAGDLVGTVTSQGTAGRLGLGSLTVGGVIRSGSLNVAGQTGTITTGGSLGTAGQSLTIVGGVNKILVGSRRTPGTTLGLNLTVNGAVGSLQVDGRITGSVHVLGAVRSLTVNGDGTSPDAVTGPVQVDGKLTAATINDGNLAANLTVNTDLTNLTINRGSIASGATVTALLGSIRTLRITGGLTYGIAGSVLAPVGTGINLSISGNVGGGATPSVISSTTAGSISVQGSVEPNGTITFSGPVNSLFIGGNIAGGGTVVGHPIRRHTVRGSTDGTLIAT